MGFIESKSCHGRGEERIEKQRREKGRCGEDGWWGRSGGEFLELLKLLLKLLGGLGELLLCALRILGGRLGVL